MRTLAAISRHTGKPFQIEPVELDAPRADEVLIKVVATGLCHTDLAVRDGELPMPMPGILGHEGAGVVVAAGAPNSRLKPGDHVVMSFASCGACKACLLGRPSSCTSFLAHNFSGHRPDGSCCHSQHGERVFGNFFGQSSFATYAIVNERHLVAVARDLPLESLGPLGCGLQTGAGAVINSLKPPMGASLVVFGLGAVGMSALMAAKLCGCDPLIAVDIRPTRLALARELGATHTIDAGTGDVPGQVRKITGDGAEFMVEAIGNPALVDGCVRALRSRSSGVLLGAPKAGAKLEFDSGNLLRGIELKSVVEGEAVPRVFIPQLVELHKQGRFPFDRLLRFYDFARINEAADAMSRGDAIKPVLIMPH